MSGCSREMILKIGEFSVAGGMWSTIQRTSLQPVDHSRFARLATVDSLTDGTTIRLESVERKDRRPGRLATRLSGPRYCGASPCKTLYVSTEILNWTRSGTRRWCGQIDGDDTSVEQPHSAHTGVGEPSRPEDRPTRCCRNPDVLALGWPPATGTCQSALSGESAGVDVTRQNTERLYVEHGSNRRALRTS